MDKPLHLGIVGIGGYARAIAQLALEHGAACRPAVRLVACSDPMAEELELSEAVASLRSAGVDVSPRNRDVLEREDIDAVWLPLPIHLHRPMAERALRAGKAVMCEKPAAGTVADVEAMIAAREAAGRPCLIGFQDVYEPHVVNLKHRLLAGEFGAVQAASVTGCWPRPASYFTRNGWAGRLSVPGLNGEAAWVLDSPLNNAMSHFVHLALFLLGPAMDRNLRVARVEAELYRAARIESFDTVGVRVRAADDRGPALLVLLTHAAAEQVSPVVEVQCEKAVIVKQYFDAEVRWRDGRVEPVPALPPFRRAMLKRFAQACGTHGSAQSPAGPDHPQLPGATLEMAMEHTRLVNAVHMATSVTDISGRTVRAGEAEDPVAALPGIESAIAQAGAAGRLLCEVDLLDWTRPAERFDLPERFTYQPPA